MTIYDILGTLFSVFHVWIPVKYSNNTGGITLITSNLEIIKQKHKFSSVQLLSSVRLFVTPWIAAGPASLSITNSWSLFKLMSIESVMSSNRLILCHPLLLSPLIFLSIRAFSNESTLHMKWPKYWSFSFSIIPSKEIPGLISFFRLISHYYHELLKHEMQTLF